MDLSSLNKEYWANEMQMPLFVENTAVFLADMEPSNVLTADGKKYHKPIISTPKTGTYTPYSAITDNQLKSSDQYLEVDQFKYANEVIDDTDKKQNFYDAASFAAQSMQKSLNNLIEQHWLSQVTSALNTVDAGSVGGTAGSYIQLTTANTIKVFTAAHTKLDSQDAPTGNRYAVVGPHTLATLREVKASRQDQLGDKVLENGIVGNWLGWTIVVNNNLPFSALLKVATQPSDGNTVTIAGVTFTFKTTLGSTAGNVLIGQDAAAARANLAAAVAGSTGAGSTYIEVSSNNRHVLSKRSISMTTAEDMALSGFGDIVVSETLTNAADVWSEQKQKSVFLVRGAIDLAVQMPSKVEVVRSDTMFADKIRALEMFKAKAFDDGARLLVSVNIDASQWV
jgi:hypothetical protein